MAQLFAFACPLVALVLFLRTVLRKTAVPLGPTTPRALCPIDDPDPGDQNDTPYLPWHAPYGENFLPYEDWQPPPPATPAAGNLLCPVCGCRPCLPHCRLGLSNQDLHDLGG